MKNGPKPVARAIQKADVRWLYMQSKMRYCMPLKTKTSVEGATLYVTLSPCLACSRIIFSMGIKRVIYFNSYAEFKNLASDEGVDFLNKFGVECTRYTGKLDNVTHMI
jgi:dCMP deaminase